MFMSTTMTGSCNKFAHSAHAAQRCALRGSTRTMRAPLRVVEGLAQQKGPKGSTQEGPVKAGGCSLMAAYYFRDACYC